MREYFTKALMLAVFVAPGLAFAIGGEVIDLNQSPQEFIPSFCKVIQKFQNRPDCTGSLIAPDTVVTAAHCVETQDDRKHLEVQCGFEKRGDRFKPSFTSMVRSIKTDPRYYSDSSRAIQNDTFLSEAAIDFAVLKLRRSTSITPLKVPASLEDVTERFFSPAGADPLQDRLIHDGVECRYAGFGEDTHFHAGNPTLAKIYSGKNENYDFLISFGKPQELYNLHSFAVGLPFLRNQPKPDVTTGPKNQMLEGDSGGPVVCRASVASEWTLIGINSRTLQPDNYFDAVVENGRTQSMLNLNSGTFEMGFAPTFSEDFRKLLE